jgi:hypothetical protein
MQHIHYGDWTIEWCDSDYGHDFAIGNESYRIGSRAVELLYLGVGSFTLVEYGIDACKKLITEIIAAQKGAAIRITEKYVNERMGYTVSIEQTPSTEKDNSDPIPF